jgi:hypothetical protein
MTLKKTLTPLVLIFIFINSFILLSKNFLISHGFDNELLLIGNFLLFSISIAAMLIQLRGVKSTNPNVFVRSVYVVMIIKLFIVAIVLTTYILLNNRIINKPAIFTLMSLYVVYTVLEVSGLMKLLRKKNV